MSGPKNIHIQWLSDSHDCETCGSDYSEGAIVSFDGEQAISLIPVAHCFDNRTWDSGEVYNAILEKLGHTVSEETQSQ